MIEPSGKPIIMYTAPELYNKENKLYAVDAVEVDVCLGECLFKGAQLCQYSTIFELCCEIMIENDLDIPLDATQATDLYLFLRHTIEQEVNQ